METRPRTRKRLSERILESLFDFALLVVGDAPSLAACFFSIRGRVSGTEFKIELKSFVWRPSEQIDFSATPQRQNGDSHTSLPCGTENFSKSKTKKVRQNRTRVLRPNSLINVREVASGAAREEEI